MKARLFIAYLAGLILGIWIGNILKNRTEITAFVDIDMEEIPPACPSCGQDMQIVRPGHYQCPDCILCPTCGNVYPFYESHYCHREY